MGRHTVLKGRKKNPFLLLSGIQLVLRQKADSKKKANVLHGSILRCDIAKWVNLDLFRPGLTKRKVTRQRAWARGRELGELGADSPLRLLSVFPEMRLLSSGRSKGTSRGRVCRLLQGEDRGSFAHLPFLKFLQLKIVYLPNCHIWRSVFGALPVHVLNK